MNTDQFGGVLVEPPAPVDAETRDRMVKAGLSDEFGGTPVQTDRFGGVAEPVNVDAPVSIGTGYFDNGKETVPPANAPRYSYDDSRRDSPDWDVVREYAKNPSDFPKAAGVLLSAPGKLAYLAAADAVSKLWNEPEYGGNLTSDAVIKNGGEFPVDKFVAQAAKTNPNLAVTAKLGEAATEMAPALGLSAAPAAVNRLLAAGFSADMIRKAPQLFQDYADEINKPTDEQDAGKLADLKSQMIQTFIFAPLAGAGTLHGEAATPGKIPVEWREIQSAPKDEFGGKPVEEVPSSKVQVPSEKLAEPPIVQTRLDNSEAPVTPAEPAATPTTEAAPPELTETPTEPEEPANARFAREQREAMAALRAQPREAAPTEAQPMIPTERVEGGTPIQTFERPPDIIDDVLDHYTRGVRVPDTEDFAGHWEAIKGLKQSKAAELSGTRLKMLFEGSNDPDKVLDTLHRNGKQLRVQSGEELVGNMIDAARGRLEWAKREKATAKFSPPSEVESPKSEDPDWSVGEYGPADYVGMGGAVPDEFVNRPGVATAIKNAAVDAERVKRGLPPAIEPLRRSFGDVWGQAMARIDQDPASQDNLINELREKPRAVTDHEDAMLLQRQVDLQNQYGKATRDLAQAYEDSKEFPNRLDAVADLKLRTAKLSDDLLDLYNINKSVGTETGRGLAARRMMAYEDYSLAKMELDRRAANGGRSLSDAERAEVQQLHDKIAATQKAHDDYVAKTEAERSQRQANEEINDIVNRVAKTPGYDRNVMSLADRIVGALDKEAAKAAVRLKAKLARTNAGVDPTILGDLAVMGAAKLAHGTIDFTRWSKEMIADLGEEVVPWLNQTWKKSNERLDDAVSRVAKGKTAVAVRRAVRKEDITGQRESIIEGIRGQKGQPLRELGPYVRKLAENFVRSGVKDRDALVGKVHEVLTTEVDPNITRRQAMDAISGYGDFKPLNPDEIKTELRGLKGQMQQVAKLEDIQAKKPLLKSGIERRVPDDEERRLIQQVNEAKRRYGVVQTDPRSQLKSALDAIKTRLQNQIKDLQFQIDTKEKIVRTKTAVPFDAEATRLKMERDELKKKYDEVFTKPGLTDAQRVQNALRTVKASIEEYERRLASKDISRTESKTPETPELAAARSRRDALRSEYQNLVDATDPGRREQAVLTGLKTRLQQRTADLQERLTKGDFTTRPRRTVTLDAEALRLKANMQGAKQAFQRALVADRLKNRPGYVKFMDGLIRWRRGFLLSSPVTLAKLTSAAAQRLLFTPIEEGIGGVIGKVLPGLAARAPREGGFNVNAEAKALTEGFVQGMKDSWDQLRTGQSQMDVLFGRGREGAIGESDVLPRSIIDFFGQMHSALKAPVKRAEFTRSFEKRMAWNMRQGVDVRDPAVQTRVAMEAYKDANRSIFLQDNRIVTGYKMLVKGLEKTPAGSQYPTIGGKFSGFIARGALPIVRVPTNLVAETFQHMLGLVSGSARLGWAMRKGIETLPPDQADLIMRHLKKGSIGGAVLLAGYLMPNAIGGYYQPGQKRDKADVPVGGLRIGGVTVPTYLLHNPLLETLQIGATIRRVADAKLHKKDSAPQGTVAGLLAGGLGLSEEVPFVRQTMDLQKLMDPQTRNQFIGEFSKNIVVPQLVQWLAKHTDDDNTGQPVARKAQNSWQQFETGIPGLRQNVPLAPAPPNAIVTRYMQKVKGGTPEMRNELRQTLLRNLATNPPTTHKR